MTKRKLIPEEAAALAKDLLHAYLSGEPEQWFSHLCSESIWVGNGEPILFGGDAIRKHFQHLKGVQSTILQEEFYPLSLSADAAQVCGYFVLGETDLTYRTKTWFTLTFRLIDGEPKLVHQHHSYEHIRVGNAGGKLNLDQNAMLFVKSLLLDRPRQCRIPVRSGKQTVYVNPYSLLYVQSHGKHTEFVCTDRVISCNSPIGVVAKDLPEEFYPIHRGYLVNTAYIVAVRRFEAELFDGTTIPIPAPAYTKVKADLARLLKG